VSSNRCVRKLRLEREIHFVARAGGGQWRLPRFRPATAIPVAAYSRPQCFHGDAIRSSGAQRAFSLSRNIERSRKARAVGLHVANPTQIQAAAARVEM
jgi:hypothetical protein